MTRRTRGKPISGWVIINKPVGINSSRVVGLIKKRFDAQKAGHGGTLDPLASGVLPIALGEATKLISLAMDGRKIYRFTVQWGNERTTDDAEGGITNISDVRPKRCQIQAALDEFIGDIEQIPPKFSAIKVDGKRAYELARTGQKFSLEPRAVKIFSFDLIRILSPDAAEFRVECGKGTYIRSLARDFARRLGTFGYVARLHRVSVGPFGEGHANSLDSFDHLVYEPHSSGYLLPIEAALADIPALAFNPRQVEQIRHGRPVPMIDFLEDCSDDSFTSRVAGAPICAMADGRLVALVFVKDNFVCPKRVLNLNS
jgi:tRNA pseudouridine55 synthase